MKKKIVITETVNEPRGIRKALFIMFSLIGWPLFIIGIPNLYFNWFNRWFILSWLVMLIIGSILGIRTEVEFSKEIPMEENEWNDTGESK